MVSQNNKPVGLARRLKWKMYQNVNKFTGGHASRTSTFQILAKKPADERKLLTTLMKNLSRFKFDERARESMRAHEREFELSATLILIWPGLKRIYGKPLTWLFLHVILSFCRREKSRDLLCYGKVLLNMLDAMTVVTPHLEGKTRTGTLPLTTEVQCQHQNSRYKSVHCEEDRWWELRNSSTRGL